MIDNRKNPWYYIIPLVLGFMIGGTAGWLLGNHPVLGGFAGWVLFTVYFLIVGGLSKPKGTLNSLAVLAILGLPEWKWAILILVHIAALVGIALMVRSCIIFEQRLKGECNV